MDIFFYAQQSLKGGCYAITRGGLPETGKSMFK